ncbi:MAG: acyltransferase family protein [Clostridiales bacterium]|nr:acyltransferase family protein [Clostridiales bacterium]
MFNHTDTKGFLLFSVSQDFPFYWVYLFMSIGCKFAVPLFFMISGALLLKKEESIGTVYKKRVSRMVLILLVISLFYAFYDSFKNGTPFVLVDFLTQLYSSRLSTALWYLYAYLALLMALPLLRKLACNLTFQEYVYWAGMSILISGIIPILEYRFFLDEITGNSILRSALFTTMSIVHFSMGYFFEYVLPEKYYTVKNACIGVVLSFLCVGLCCYMTDFRAAITGEGGSQVFHNSLASIPAYTIYFSGKLFFMKKKVSERAKKAICLVGSTTFGIFLLERMLRTETQPVFTALEPVIGTMPACLVWVAAAFLLGFLITLVLKKIPVVGKYI